MSLNKELLLTEIRKINDSSFSLFESWPVDFNEACERWSEAIRIYAEKISPFAEGTTELALNKAKESMKSYLMSNGNVQGNIFEDSIVIFATTFASEPNVAWNSIPPTLELNLSEIKYRGMTGSSAENIAIDLSNNIHVWFLTGTAINIESGISVNWN